MTLLNAMSTALDEHLKDKPLGPQELDAIEHYANSPDSPDSIALAYMRRAVRELRALRTPATKPPPEHLPECTPDKGPDDRGQCEEKCPVWLALQRDETRLTTGKWTCSTNEEHFDCHEMFDTEAEAIEYGKEFAADMGLIDGEIYWTGRIDALTPEEVAEGCADAERWIETIEERISDNFATEDFTDLEVPPDAVADLEQRMEKVLLDWLVFHDLTPNICRIEKTESHLFKQCEEVDSMKGDPNNHPRCIRHAGHTDADGHDFP